MCSDGQRKPPVARKIKLRRLAWGLSVLLPLVLLPFWIIPWGGDIPRRIPLAGTFTGVLLLLVAGIAGFSDIRWRRIPNWATYSATLWALALNAYHGQFASPEVASQLGTVGLGDCLAGAAVMFLLMFVIFRITGGGAGDVKMVTALGALLGLRLALDAVLYSFLFAGTVVLGWAIWSHGPVTLLKAMGRLLGSFLLPTWVAGPSEQQQRLLRSPIPLAPFFAAGALVVTTGVRLEGWL